jgi:YYY domain-containing protein
VLLVVGLALALRLYGLDWDRGYDWTPHPDERAILSKVEQLSPPSLGDLGSLLDADESPWNPRWFPYGSLPLYLLKSVDLVYGLFPGDGLQDLRVTGRAVSALADVATVFMVFVLGSRLYGRREALLASALAALAVVHIQLSHFFAVDTFLALFTVVSLYFLLRVAREGRVRDSVLAGVFIGLALATKVSLAPIFGAFFVAHVMYAFSLSGTQTGEQSFSRRWPAATRGMAAGLGVSLVVLFIAQPYMFLDWDRFYHDVVEQSEMVRRIGDLPFTRQYIDTTPYWYQMRQLAAWGLGWPLGIVAWAGLLYVALRGMRPRFALAYLAVGWGVPIAVLLLVSTSFAAIFLASVIALAALLGTLLVRSQESRTGVLLLSWVVPSFLITGAFEVKFLRYLLPITPFLLLFGSQMFFALWDRADTRGARRWLAAGLVVLLGSTAFYALSYTSVYREEHTAVRASDWINQNAPRGSVLLKEHWEEALPGLAGYELRELPLYDPDSPDKTRRLSDELAGADYLIFYSNRLYGTIPRLPDRYPNSAAYYTELFSGRLGYQLVDYETSYPKLLGVAFVDDTFDRPDVPEPEALRESKPAFLSLDLGFADESFSVYDHPKVLVMRNVGGYDAATIGRVLEAAAPPYSPPTFTLDTGGVGLMLSPEDAEAQQAGGTWTEIVRPGSWANRVPALAWLVMMEGMALVALPITFLLFRPLTDRGYLFAKVVGLLGVGLVVWLLASVEWMAFSRLSIAVAFLVVGLVSAAAAFWKRDELVSFVRRRWPVLLIGEVLFLAAFFSFVLLRMANPDLWHPWRGGEKPMDLAYLNAVLRSSYMPPYDPWFGGGYLNYYYWGQFLVATLIKATGIEPTVAYNLAVPMFFAMVVGGSFSIVYNLAEGTRQALAPEDPEQGRTDASPDSAGWWAALGSLHWSPVAAGMGAALFVAVLGNLDGAIQVGQGAWRTLSSDLPFGQFNFWQSSRMMPSDLQGITEFPFFTFLFADLHAHLMAMPFTLLALGLALAVVLGAVRRGRPRPAWSLDDMLRLGALGVVVGSLRLLNAWDFPTYLMIGVAAVFLAEFFVHGGLGLGMLVRGGVKSAFVFVVGYVVFLPFHLSYETFFDSVEATTDTTVLWRFLGIGGLFIFIVGTFFLRESRDWLATAGREIARLVVSTARAASADDDSPPADGGPRIGAEAIALLLLVLVALGFGLTAAFSGTVGSTVPFVAVLLLLVFVAAVRWLVTWRADAPYLVFVALAVGVSLSLAIGLDIYRLEGDIDRMNSVFKFYLQIWVLLALASAYLLWRLAYRAKAGVWARVWVGGLALLILSASVYPVLGTRDRLGDRFYDRVLPLTLDGTAFVEGTVYRDQEGDIDLAADFQGIRWLQENVEGSPIVLEGNTPTYRWGGRVSVYTGLPSVVGWKWHQEQQRWDYSRLVGLRIDDVNRIYGTNNPQEALSLLNEYGVRYVYVGQLERLYYPQEGLDKFERMIGAGLSKVFQSQQVAIYRVSDDGA